MPELKSTCGKIVRGQWCKGRATRSRPIFGFVKVRVCVYHAREYDRKSKQARALAYSAICVNCQGK